jgi:hypothetical protein
MSIIVIVVLMLLLVGVLPTWPHSADWGYYPSGGPGLMFLVLAILVLTGLLGRRIERPVATVRALAQRRIRSYGDGHRAEEAGCMASRKRR